MRQFITSAVVTAALLTAASSVEANHKPNHRPIPQGKVVQVTRTKVVQTIRGNVGYPVVQNRALYPVPQQKVVHPVPQVRKDVARFRNYHTTYGTKFSHGHYYAGRKHNHWTHRSYFPRYRCHCYWCPGARGWYYWCAPRSSYFPMSYIGIAPPVVVANAPRMLPFAGAATAGAPAILPGMEAAQEFQMLPEQE